MKFSQKALDILLKTISNVIIFQLAVMVAANGTLFVLPVELHLLTVLTPILENAFFPWKVNGIGVWSIFMIKS